MIVEDDMDIQNIYQENLVSEGYEVVTVGTIDEAMTKLMSFLPDLILLDIMLPGGKNGFDFLEYLKKEEKYTKIPVIVLTNLDSERETSLKIGAVDYIVKANSSIGNVLKQVKQYTS